MRFAAALCLAPLALAGCMPSDEPFSAGLAPSAATARPGLAGAQTAQAQLANNDDPETALPVVASTFHAPAFAPIPPKRPDFEGVTPASRALGAIVADAEQVDEQLDKQAAAAAPAQPPANVRIIEYPTGGGPAQRVIASPPPVPLGDPSAAAPAAPASQAYYAAYDDTDISCFPQALRAALNTIAQHYGQQVEVTSGFRDHGRAHSMHRFCMAADIRVPGVGPRELAEYAKTIDGVNGVGTYRYNTVTHIDIRQDRMAWRY